MRVFRVVHARLQYKNGNEWNRRQPVKKDERSFLDLYSHLNAAHGKRRFVFAFTHPIWRPAIVKMEPAFILTSDRHGFSELGARFYGFPGEANEHFGICPVHLVNPGG
jgi:hypothetical protein